MRTILSRALAELNAHRSVVLVTIVAEQGSAPRGPGSQMLVGADGQLTGTIGGGQVERQSELLALSLLKEQRSQIQHFALNASRGGQPRPGLRRGCDGAVSVHLPGGHPLAECVGNGAGPAHRCPSPAG